MCGFFVANYTNYYMKKSISQFVGAISNRSLNRASFVKRFLICSLLIPAILLTTAFTLPNWAAARAQVIDNRTEVRLPILMYHSVLASKTGKYTVNPDDLEKDIIALKKAGFETVFMQDVIDWVDGKGNLPEKPIVITFDDGHYNNVSYGLPIAQKHDVKFLLNPVTSFSKYSVDSGDHSNPNYSHLTWEQMRDAHKSGHIEFGNHTHAMHKFKPRYGVMKIGGECDETYRENLRNDIEQAQRLIEEAGVPSPTTFAYPFGKYSAASKQALLDMGFRALLTCNELINTIQKGKPETLHSLGRYNRDGHFSTEKVLELVGADV